MLILSLYAYIFVCIYTYIRFLLPGGRAAMFLLIVMLPTLMEVHAVPLIKGKLIQVNAHFYCNYHY